MNKTAPWFAPFAQNVTSQFGEDGIIEKALEIIGESNQWCVEFGAADGKYCSNTHSLIQTKGYSAVLIEADRVRYRELVRTYEGNPRVTLLNVQVGFDAHNKLDAILSGTGVPFNLDVLSIDIDGNDYYVWDTLETYRPRLLVIEYNPTIPSPVEFVQRRDMRVAQGCSLLALVQLGKRKAYELIAATHCNAIFVDAVYYERFGLQDNSIAVLREDKRAVTYIFSGFDGTVFLRGCERLPWHGVRLKESRFQALPWFLRRYPDRYSWPQRVLSRVHSRLRKWRVL